jgi:3-dehydroquinate synthase
MPGNGWGIHMYVIDVKSNIKDYSASIAPIHDYLVELLKVDHKLFIIDENVYRIYKDTILKDIPEESLMLFPALEDKKDLDGVQEIYDFFINRSAKRNLTLITIGGGILQDVTGFVASTLYRGINWILIPTTLLAQADSCIGSKTSLNYKGYKNLIGSFYPPSKVWIDPTFVNSLKKEDYYSGLGEVIKLHIMGGHAYHKELESDFKHLCDKEFSIVEKSIYSSLQIKLNYMAGDEFDLGRRNLLNYGHCVGHAIESLTNFRIPHGQAIIIGMIIANQIAVSRGLLSEQKCTYYEKTFLLPALITPLHPDELNLDAIIEAMGKDKKRTGKGLVVVMVTEKDDLVRANDLNRDEVILAFQNKENIILRQEH